MIEEGDECLRSLMDVFDDFLSSSPCIGSVGQSYGAKKMGMFIKSL